MLKSKLLSVWTLSDDPIPKSYPQLVFRGLKFEDGNVLIEDDGGSRDFSIFRDSDWKLPSSEVELIGKIFDNAGIPVSAYRTPGFNAWRSKVAVPFNENTKLTKVVVLRTGRADVKQIPATLPFMNNAKVEVIGAKSPSEVTNEHFLVNLSGRHWEAWFRPGKGQKWKRVVRSLVGEHGLNSAMRTEFTRLMIGKKPTYRTIRDSRQDLYGPNGIIPGRTSTILLRNPFPFRISGGFLSVGGFGFGFRKSLTDVVTHADNGDYYGFDLGSGEKREVSSGYGRFFVLVQINVHTPSNSGAE